MTSLPSIFVIGAGAVATALAGALRLAGAPVLGLWARRPDAMHAAAAIAGVPAAPAGSGGGAAPGAGPSGPALPAAASRADIVLVAVRDQAIPEVAGRLVDAGVVDHRHVLLHCSGARAAAEAFGPACARVGGAGTLHPLRAIADPGRAMRELSGTIFGVEGDARGLDAARALALAVGGKPLVLAGAHMTAYHAAAAMVSNYTVALIDAAAALLARAGIDEPDAVAALVPLAQGSLANVAARGVAAGLTGPIRRGDRGTVARHLHALADAPDLDALYRALGRRTVDIARRVPGASRAELDAIAALLDHTSAPGGAAEHSDDG